MKLPRDGKGLPSNDAKLTNDGIKLARNDAKLTSDGEKLGATGCRTFLDGDYDIGVIAPEEAKHFFGTLIGKMEFDFGKAKLFGIDGTR